MRTDFEYIFGEIGFWKKTPVDFQHSTQRKRSPKGQIFNLPHLLPYHLSYSDVICMVIIMRGSWRSTVPSILRLRPKRPKLFGPLTYSRTVPCDMGHQIWCGNASMGESQLWVERPPQDPSAWAGSKCENFLSCLLSWDSSAAVGKLRVHNLVCFYSKTGFWLSYCQISTDLDKISHTPIVTTTNTGIQVGRLRPRSAIGAWTAPGQTRTTICFCNTCNTP